MTARIAALVLAALVTAGCSGGMPSKGVAAHPTPTSQSQSVPPPEPLPRLEGSYKVVAGVSGTPPNTWVFTSCGDGCAQVEIKESSQRGTARFVKTDWTMDIHSPRALTCGDGSPVAGTAHYSWNPDTLQGRYWSTSDSDKPCGYDQSLDTYPVPLTLTWDGPPRAGA